MNDQPAPRREWMRVFLSTLADIGKVTTAAETAGVAPAVAYYYRRRDPRFAAAWEAALAPEALAAPVETEGSAPLRSGWRNQFLEALAETSNVAASAARAQVPLRTVYKTRRDDPGFAARWREALYEGYDNLEMEVVGYLRDPAPKRKLDVASALRLLVAHRETVARERALREDDDEQAVFDSIDKFIDEMRDRRATNAAILSAPETGDGED